MSQGGPVHEIRRGRVWAVIREDGRTPGMRRLRITLGWLYWDETRWKDSRYFRPEDLAAVGELLEEAQAWTRAGGEGRGAPAEPSSGHG